MTSTQAPRHKVVVIGSGFGGLFGTKALRRADVDVTVIAKTTHHLFQPLLYQVATGILSEGEIAPPTREILAGQDNARVILGEVTGIDLEARTVTSQVLGRETVTSYDSLLVAAGASQSYFGNDHFAEFAPGMKSIDDALELRGRIFGAFEMAELGATRGDDVDHLLTFVVVGAAQGLGAEQAAEAGPDHDHLVTGCLCRGHASSWDRRCHLMVRAGLRAGVQLSNHCPPGRTSGAKRRASLLSHTTTQTREKLW